MALRQGVNTARWGPGEGLASDLARVDQLSTGAEAVAVVGTVCCGHHSGHHSGHSLAEGYSHLAGAPATAAFVAGHHTYSTSEVKGAFGHIHLEGADLYSLAAGLDSPDSGGLGSLGVPEKVGRTLFRMRVESEALVRIHRRPELGCNRCRDPVAGEAAAFPYL